MIEKVEFDFVKNCVTYRDDDGNECTFKSEDLDTQYAEILKLAGIENPNRDDIGIYEFIAAMDAGKIAV